MHSHNEHNKFLSAFDDANVLECYRRAESIVPQQALALENSKLALSAGDKIVTLHAGSPNEPTTVHSRRMALTSKYVVWVSGGSVLSLPR